MTSVVPHNALLLNASRVPSVGGLHAFTVSVMRCIASSGRNGTTAIVSPGTETPEKIERLDSPESILMVQGSSWPRSLRGFLYAIRQSWRYRESRVLSTTHLGLPGHRLQVLTVHDLRPLQMPDTCMQHLYFRYILPRTLRRADGILTVSESSRYAIAQTYGIAPEKIFVVPNVVRTLQPVDMQAAPSYLLMVNATYRHKNAGEFLEQHALWSQRYRLKILAGEGEYRESLRFQVKAWA